MEHIYIALPLLLWAAVGGMLLKNILGGDMDYFSRLRKAVDCYFDRFSGQVMPEGKFYADEIFLPAKRELKSCCELVEKPTKYAPYTMYWHCCSEAHIAKLYRVELKDLSEKIKERLRHEIETLPKY